MSTGIRGLPQWVGYKLKPKIKNGQPVMKPNGKPKMDKVPMNPCTGGHAQTNNPATWTDFDTAVSGMNRYKFNGLGFVFTKEAGITGIDLDDCLIEGGALNGFAQDVITQMNSYTEFSPSGDGVHILVRGLVPRAFKNGQIEMYDNGRFFTYTGERLPGYEDVGIRNRQDELDRLFEQVAGKTKPVDKLQNTPKTAVTLDDQALLDKAMNAANGTKFSALWRGDISGYDSQSEADFALCHLLAFWTGNDETAVDRLFRQSGLYREKWDEKHYSNGATYGQQTAVRAIANNTQVYESTKTSVSVSTNGQGVEMAVGISEILMPPLPETAVIDPALSQGVCPWLDAYVDFSRRMSPRGYDDFHEAIGLWLLSTVAARRLVVRMGTKAFYPNLYLTLCSHTTLYAKTTTAQVAQEVLHAAGLSYLLLPNDMTPQAFINELVLRLRQDYGELSPEQQRRENQRLRFPAQRGWFYDEFGTKIKAMMKDSGFMADFRGLLRIFDDNPTRYEYKTMTRRDTVEGPYLALLASMTPADVRPYAKPGAALWQDGFWARWAFITPTLNHPPKYGRFSDIVEEIPTALSEPIHQWHKALGIPQITIEAIINDEGDPTGKYTVDRDKIQPKSCSLGTGVMDAYYAYHDSLVTLAAAQAVKGNTDLIGNYGRFAEKSLRVAMLLASISNQNRIELTHWARAQMITERWRANLHHLSEQMQKQAPSEERQLQDKITNYLLRKGKGTSAEIGRNIRNVSGPEVDAVCKRLEKSGILSVVEVTKRKTNRYGIA